MKLRFWGVRGSLPAPGRASAGLGGNTSCLELRAAGELVVIDLGSGARALGAALGSAAPPRIHCLLSHLHHDHVQGLPFFAPCLDKRARLSFYGPRGAEEGLRALFGPPYFPRPLEALGAALDFRPLDAGAQLELAPGLKLACAELPHPGGCLGFRLEARESGRSRALAYCTDAELGEEPPAAVVELARGAEVLVCDAQYRESELAARRGWGHSSPLRAARLAKLAGVKRLFLTHHDPARADAEAAALESEARAVFPAAWAAAEGLELEF